MAKRRVLFVDDEANIRLTLPAILGMHGYQVESAASVAEALSKIQNDHFDVLIADLNIGEPGDGFTVVSALRRTQPDAVTIILTGYPAFETALDAIRQQVDDYVVKPATVDSLVRTIEDKLRDRKHHAPLPLVRAYMVLAQHQGEIVEAWLHAVEKQPDLAKIPVSRVDRTDHVPQILAEVIAHLHSGEDGISESSLEKARAHGEARRIQGYSVAQVIQEACLLRAAIMDLLQQNLLGIDISHLLSDMNEINIVVDRLLEESVRSFLGELNERAA